MNELNFQPPTRVWRFERPVDLETATACIERQLRIENEHTKEAL